MPARNVVLVAAAVALMGIAPAPRTRVTGSFRITVAAGPYVAGSRVPLTFSGVDGRVIFSKLGPGTVRDGFYLAPNVRAKHSVLLIGSGPGAIATRRIEIVPPPPSHEPLIAVAAYRDGIALHDARTFRFIGYFAIGAAPGDVAFDAAGAMFATQTDGDALVRVTRAPWHVTVIRDVPLGNEVAVSRASGGTFVTDRDAGGSGALTRIGHNGKITRVKTGDAAEGLAIDAARRIVFVGNVVSNTVAVVDARNMRVLRSVHSVPRPFGLAFDTRNQRLYVVSNTSAAMPAHAGYVVAMNTRARIPAVVARSGRLSFPLGAAIDARRGRVFVTDEASNTVYVLDATTLHAAHSPLATCETPWRPRIVASRLYVPCADADKVDVFDLNTLSRVHGAPFRTGGYPLAVAGWVK